MKYQALLLDFDGTILDTERHNFRTWQEVGRRLGLSITHEFYQSLIGLSKVDSDALWRQQFGQDCPLDEWRVLRRTIFYELWDQGQGPAWKAGLNVLLAELERRCYPKAIASSSLKAELDHKLERAALLHHFPVRVAGDEVAAGKPSPDVFLEAARRLGVEPHRCLAVEDSPLGVRAARSAGIPVVFVPDLVHPDASVQSESLAVVSNLAEVVSLL